MKEGIVRSWERFFHHKHNRDRQVSDCQISKSARRFPVDNAFRSAEFTDRVNLSKELAPGLKGARHFHLQILLRSRYPNSIILGEPLEQVNPLMIGPVPGVVLRVGK